MKNEKYWSCERKIRYRNQKKALNHIRHMKKKGVLFMEPPETYKCKYCGGWHIAHRKSKEPGRTRREMQRLWKEGLQGAT